MDSVVGKNSVALDNGSTCSAADGSVAATAVLGSTRGLFEQLRMLEITFRCVSDVCL